MKKIILFGIVVFVLFIYGCSEGQTKMGRLGSTHDHANFKLYILGNNVDFGNQRYQIVHEAVHFENRDGEVIHTHATGITLGFLFEKHRMKLENDCLTLETGNKYCSDGNAKLKVFVKGVGAGWEQIYSPAEYIIWDLDSIIVTYGTEDEESIRQQLESVADKAKTY